MKVFRVIISTVIMLCLIAVTVGCECGHTHTFADGKCSECGYICRHDWDEDVLCTECGIKLADDITLMPAKSRNGNIYGMLFTPSVYYGKLPTVVISHGFGVNASVAMAKMLARRGYACYAFDFCGGSASTRSDMAMENMSIDTEKVDLLAVFELVKELDIVDRDRIYLYGESQGGLVTALTAVEIKDSIAGIILMYPGFSAVSDMAVKYASWAEVPERVEVFEKSLKRGYAEALMKYLPENYERITETDPKELLRKRLSVTGSLYEYVSEFDGRVIILHGTKDDVVDIAFSREAVKYYRDVELVEMPGERHTFAIEAYNKAVKRIDAFLKK